MNIRRYKIGEELAIWEVYYGSTRNIVAREYTDKQVERWAPDDYDMKSWKAKLAKSNPFVAVINDRVVGFAELEDNGHIDYFYCHHEFQRQGIGSALLQKILTEAEHLGINRLFAEVSTTAQKFFLANGFNVDEESNNVVCGQPARQYKMSRQKTP